MRSAVLFPRLLLLATKGGASSSSSISRFLARERDCCPGRLGERRPALREYVRDTGAPGWNTAITMAPQRKFHRVTCFLLIGMIVFFGLILAARNPSGQQHRGVTRNEYFLSVGHPEILEHSGQADMIVIGRVTKIGKGDFYWSGAVASYQQVHYEALEYVKTGRHITKSKEIVVSHPLVMGSPTAAEGIRPKLRESMFSTDSEIILFLREDRDHGLVEVGALPNEPASESAVTSTLRK